MLPWLCLMMPLGLSPSSQGLNGVSHECKETEELTNGHFNHKPVSTTTNQSFPFRDVCLNIFIKQEFLYTSPVIISMDW